MLEGWEWLIIGVIAIVVILWGPAKIPEFAKALGRAKGEFSKAQQEFSAAALTAANTPTAATAPTVTAPPQAIKSKDEILLDTARNLGLSTDGKTREEITQEISEKVKLLGAETTPA
jgi:sec-independent protein translocase protein TatA